MLDLNIPDPPASMSYAQFEDYRNRAILQRNNIPLSEAELIDALGRTTNILQAAVAHTLGSLASTAASPALSQLLKAPEDLVRVEAAYALARMGVGEGRDVLVQCLSYPVDAYLFPAIAAGYLAQLGDSQGFSTVVSCLDQEIPAIRMIACKQLYFFVPFQGQPDTTGKPVEVLYEFSRALRDADSDVQWQALVQLRELRLPGSRGILQEYAENASDEQLREVASATLASLTA
jgi:HEAT repeat protein